jgi:hypothetical protein
MGEVKNANKILDEIPGRTNSFRRLMYAELEKKPTSKYYM